MSKTSWDDLLTEVSWNTAISVISQHFTKANRHWLKNKKSTTHKMQKYCKTLEIVVLKHTWLSPTLAEIKFLKLKFRKRYLIREILMVADGTPWLYARAIIPREFMVGRLRRLQQLGKKPLGKILFHKLPISRSCYEYGLTISAYPLPARRSFFKNENGIKLWLQEIFLSDLLKFLDRK